MGYQGLGIGVGIAQGIEKASETIMNVTLMKHQLTQEHEKHKINLKQKKLEIEKMENELDPIVVESAKKRLAEENKMATSAATLQNMALDDMLRGAKTAREEGIKVYDFLNSIDTEGIGLDLGVGIGGEKKEVWEKSGVSEYKRNKLIGTIKSGYYEDEYGTFRKAKDRQQIENYLNREGYLNFSEDPILSELLNKQFPVTPTGEAAWWLQ